MKKTIFILSAFIFCLSFTALSQKARVGLTGGISVANLSRTISSADKDGEYRIGITGGMQLEVPLKLWKNKNFSFQPDLRYIQKGASDISSTPTLNKIYTALRYAELAPNLVYNVKAGKGTFYFGGGPYIGLPLPSKYVTHSAGQPNVEADVTFGNAVANDLKGVDYGGNALMGFRMSNNFFVALHYIQGARNLVPDDKLVLPGASGDKIKNIAFAIRVGYLFKNTSAERTPREKKKKNK